MGQDEQDEKPATTPGPSNSLDSVVESDPDLLRGQGLAFSSSLDLPES